MSSTTGGTEPPRSRSCYPITHFTDARDGAEKRLAMRGKRDMEGCTWGLHHRRALTRRQARPGRLSVVADRAQSPSESAIEAVFAQRTSRLPGRIRLREPPERPLPRSVGTLLAPPALAALASTRSARSARESGERAASRTRAERTQGRRS